MPWPPPRRSRLSSARERSDLALRIRSASVPAPRVRSLSCLACLHFGSRDVAAVAGCGSKYLQR